MRNPAFREKIAIVTGASSGIGRATALALARRGARLSLAARNGDALERLAVEIHNLAGEAACSALVVPTDVTHQDQVDRLVQETLSHWGRIDILVANAGQYLRAPISQLTTGLLERSMAVNFYGGVYAVLAVLPHMLAQQSGHIVFVSTVDAKKGLPPDAPYVAAKCALSGFGEVLRQELHHSGVFATTVFPGRVDTPMIDNLRVPLISAKIPAETVARAILRAIERRQAEVILPPQTLLLYYLNVFLPRTADWFVRHLHLEGWQDGAGS